jgi:hypothetical protein
VQSVYMSTDCKDGCFASAQKCAQRVTPGHRVRQHDAEGLCEQVTVHGNHSQEVKGGGGVMSTCIWNVH